MDIGNKYHLSCLWLICGLCFVFIQPANGSINTASVLCKNGQCQIVRHIRTDITAFAVYNSSMFESGWDILDIKAGYGRDHPSNTDIMFAAGFLEGALTAKRIYYHYRNMYLDLSRSKPPKMMPYLRAFFAKQDIWMRKQVARYPKDPLWRHVGYVMAQFDGLIAGYRSIHAMPGISNFGFQLINSMGDVLDLSNAFNKTNTMELIKQDLGKFVFLNSHCSALIKILPGYENLYMSHSSWFWYSSMSRIYKYYDFNTKDSRTFTKKFAFSSYPGLLTSMDDFYLLGGKMVMIQTTNSIFNMSLYDLVKPESLLAWHRVRIANSMARNGRDWSQIVAFKNSGTYNNQYMVVDLRKIKLHSDIEDDALWVVEQIPGFVKSADVSDILRTGYWPSYNVPFFEEIYNRSGYNHMYSTQSQYQLAPRAKIFRRDANKISDLKSMKNMLRYNNYENDKYSSRDPWNTICSRGDLASNPSANGCYDTKVADFFMAVNLTADIISGPTLGTHLKPFIWGPQFKASHVGLPKEYNFDFIRTKPFF